MRGNVYRCRPLQGLLCLHGEVTSPLFLFITHCWIYLSAVVHFLCKEWLLPQKLGGRAQHKGYLADMKEKYLTADPLSSFDIHVKDNCTT